METIRYNTEELYKDLLKDFPIPPLSKNEKKEIINIIFTWYIQQNLNQNYDNFISDLDIMLTDLEVDLEGFTKPLTLLDYLCKRGYVSTAARDEYLFEIVTTGTTAVVVAKKEGTDDITFVGTLIHMINYLKDRDIKKVTMDLNTVYETHGHVVDEIVQRYLDRWNIIREDN